MNSLNNKVVLITGGAGLIGQEFAKAILRQQGRVVILDRNVSQGTALVSELCANYGEANVLYIELDVTCNRSIQVAIEKTHERFGVIDALVNNVYAKTAGYGAAFFDVDYDSFCANLSMNVGGYFLMSQKVSRYFLHQGYGNIVNISSIYGVIAPRFDIYKNVVFTMPVEYAAIKSAQLHLTRYLAKYLKGANIRVNAISPGGVIDNQPEEFISAYSKYCSNRGMLNQCDLNGVLVFLLSDMSKCVNGQNLIVDNGFTL
jgi:NAD(P)-dependent dehydrogenase (short-subunit alcohol dehydrogenase family)